MTTRKDLLCRILFRSVAEGFLNYITTRRDSRGSGGKTVRTYKDSYDRANKFQGRKPLRGGPEGRPQ